MSKELENLASMSLGDHLEELRIRLTLAIVGLMVGMTICLFFGKSLVRVLEMPYYNLLNKFESKRLKDVEEKKAEDEKNGIISEEDTIKLLIPYESYAISLEKAKAEFEKANGDKAEDEEKEEVTFELNIPRESFIQQLKGILEEIKVPVELSSIKPSESFLVFLKTSLFFGLILSSPWVLYQIWTFIAAGLYQNEKKYIHAVVPISAILFITGSVFFMWVIAPIMMGFFSKFDQMLGFVSKWSPQYYISLVLTLTLVFGCAFQMPIAVVFANLMGLVSIETLAKVRRFVLLGLLVVSAVATPPDFVSQIALAGPLYILYEGSIIFCRILRHRKEKATA